ncbi:hypothetical protein DCS_06631 [Drechmeria coniospora]|uniref:Uncharacterized protein n=1 Tax=Drechmeria coniospora TaxID=98403 RepID=A0A151GC87_DRECN|nr:hypothetical protein DCS_06631 [Drechmeria coniospora]KYK54671.1 hypothetical protein DCS_06631 [Drechmeria coniospora]
MLEKSTPEKQAEPSAAREKLDGRVRPAPRHGHGHLELTARPPRSADQVGRHGEILRMVP